MLLPIFKCIPEVMFCEGVQNRLRVSLSKWEPFSFIFSRGNRKLGWAGDNSRVVFGKKFPSDEEIFFLIPFYLQAEQIHSANGVKLLEA
jgi:hypothetical protein